MTELALIQGGEIVKTVTAGRGVDLPNAGGRVTPAHDGWDNGTFRLAVIVDSAATPEGKQMASTSLEMVGDAPTRVVVFEDIPPEPLRPIPRRDCFQIVLREFALTRDALRTMAGDFGAANVSEGITAAVARESALIDFDEADVFHHDNPLLVGVMTEAGLTEAQRDTKWRTWQGSL